MFPLAISPSMSLVAFDPPDDDLPDQLGGFTYWMLPTMCTLRPAYMVPCPFT